MTARLVALMSIVLFLSLLAFGLLVNHSKTAVLEEVERTISTVGSRTLHAVLERRLALDRAGLAEIDVELVRGSPGTRTDAPDHQLAWVMEREKRVVFEGRLDDGTPADPAAIERHARGFWALNPMLIAHDNPRIRVEGDDVRVAITTLFVAVPHSAQHGAEPAAGAATPTTAPATTAAATPEAQLPDAAPDTAVRDELVFNVPVAEYGRVFDAISQRMIWLFLGVFVLGTALSAALARRFTRPIRDLDRALQRIKLGDLDVAVAPAGGGELERVAVAFNEMTSELRANRERERELIRREKLSALGRLAAGVAHDVRNPLHSIGLTLQNLEDTCKPRDEEPKSAFDRAVGLIRREIKRLDGLVANFLAFARSEAAEKAPVRLSEVVRETAQLVAKEADRRGITVVVDAEPSLETIPAAAQSLRSAILNLVLNAFEATPSGGTVTLRVTARDGVQVAEVADTGAGIKDVDREKVFEFGFTTRDGGHGLGLAMVHHTIVEEHGGRVMLDSEEGRGTRVRIELPTTPASPAPSLAAAEGRP